MKLSGEVRRLPNGLLIRNSIYWWAILAFFFLISLIGALVILIPFRVLSYLIGHGELLFLILLMLVVDSTATAMNIWVENVQGRLIKIYNIQEIFKNFVSKKDILLIEFLIAFLAFLVEIAVIFAIGWFITEFYGLILGFLVVFSLMVLNNLLGREFGFSIGSLVFKSLLNLRKIKVDFANPLEWFFSVILSNRGSVTG